MKVDVEGNVYCGGSGGIWVFGSSGNRLGVIEHGATATTNMAWGDEDWRTLYFTTRDSLGRGPVGHTGYTGAGDLSKIGHTLIRRSDQIGSAGA